jgi:hypothetical protein
MMSNEIHAEQTIDEDQAVRSNFSQSRTGMMEPKDLTEAPSVTLANHRQGRSRSLPETIDCARHGRMSETATRPTAMPSATTGISWPGLKI